MDLDAFVSAHKDEWVRLEHLVRNRRKLRGPEVDELVELYQRVATHLSVVRSAAPDQALLARLSTLVARARSAVTGAHAPAWRDMVRFVVVSFPASAYRARWWWLGVGLASLGIALVVGRWLVTSPEVLARLATPDELRELCDHQFADYYSEFPATSFMFQVWTNNVWVAIQSLVYALLLGIPTLYVLLLNAANLGVSGAVMVGCGKSEVFFGLIIPHGLLELSAVFLAAAVGLRLAWTIIDPGGRPRGQALAAEGRASMAVVIGMFAVLLVSGAIEAFVTPYVGITWLRIGIGVVAEVLFIAYVLVLGRRAVRAGATGDIDEPIDAVPVSV